MNEQSIYAIFLRRVLLATALLFLIPVMISEGLKLWFGELETAEIVSRQLETKRILYLSGIDQSIAAYKLELTARQEAAVIVIGSSRTLQVRNFFFREPLLNWGLVARSAGTLEWAAQQIVRLPTKPKLVVVFLDPWWFNQNHQSGTDVFTLRNGRFMNIYENTYSLAKKAIMNGPARHPERLGVAAIHSNQGFDYYGSFHYVARVTGKETRDLRFEQTLRLIDTGKGRFVGAEAPNLAAIERWNTARARLEQAGVDVVEVFPPFSSAVIDRILASGRHAYLEKISPLMGNRPLDYSDPRQLVGGSDCEFLDGFHAGEVMNARMLLDAALKRPRLGSLLNADRLRAWVEANRGMSAPTTIALYAQGELELDYLQLGCVKDRPSKLPH